MQGNDVLPHVSCRIGLIVADQKLEKAEVQIGARRQGREHSGRVVCGAPTRINNRDRIWRVVLEYLAKTLHRRAGLAAAEVEISFRNRSIQVLWFCSEGMVESAGLGTCVSNGFVCESEIQPIIHDPGIQASSIFELADRGGRILLHKES